MPIQVVSTYKKIPPPPVDLVTAGYDVFPVCDVEVFLEAIVDPLINLQGHTVLWEQLSGTPVILTSTDTLATSYLQIINDQTDKEFRITIDIGLPEEQSDTVIVYATPTSVATCALEIDSNPHIAFDVIDAVNASTEALVPIPGNIINPDVPTVDQFIISWDPAEMDPVIESYLTLMTLYENDIPVGTWVPTDTLEYNGGANLYYMRTDFVVEGQPSWGRGITNDHTNLQIDPVHALDDVVPTMSFPTDTSLILFTNIRKQPTDETPTLNVGSELAVTDRFINSVEIIPEHFIYSGLSIGTTVITRTDPGGIGGG